MHENICEKLMRLGYIYDYTNDGFVTPGEDDQWIPVEDMIDNIKLFEEIIDISSDKDYNMFT